MSIIQSAPALVNRVKADKEKARRAVKAGKASWLADRPEDPAPISGGAPVVEATAPARQPRTVECRRCEGSGELGYGPIDPDTGWPCETIQCEACDGTGQVEVIADDDDDRDEEDGLLVAIKATCFACNGSGKEHGETCEECEGSGLVPALADWTPSDDTEPDGPDGPDGPPRASAPDPAPIGHAIPPDGPRSQPGPFPAGSPVHSSRTKHATLVIRGEPYRYLLHDEGIELVSPAGESHYLIDGACTCADAFYRGRECKHARAARDAGLLPPTAALPSLDLTAFCGQAPRDFRERSQATRLEPPETDRCRR